MYKIAKVKTMDSPGWDELKYMLLILFVAKICIFFPRNILFIKLRKKSLFFLINNKL